MEMKRYKDIKELGADLGVSPEQVAIIKMKTKIKKNIISMSKKSGISNTELAKVSGLSRSVISGIINGSLQSVSLERLIKLAMALDLSINVTCKKAI